MFTKHAKKKLDYIFFPMIDRLHTNLTHLQGSNACPTVTVTPETAKASLKSSHRKGNYQLTITELAAAGDQPAQTLLDADIDESGTFWGHAGDLFKHKISGGTHPIDVHEILVRQERDTPGFDLGYQLA